MRYLMSVSTFFPTIYVSYGIVFLSSYRCTTISMRNMDEHCRELFTQRTILCNVHDEWPSQAMIARCRCLKPAVSAPGGPAGRPSSILYQINIWLSSIIVFVVVLPVHWVFAVDGGQISYFLFWWIDMTSYFLFLLHSEFKFNTYYSEFTTYSV